MLRGHFERLVFQRLRVISDIGYSPHVGDSEALVFFGFAALHGHGLGL